MKIDTMKVGHCRFSLPKGRPVDVNPIFTSLLNSFDGFIFKFLYKTFEEKIDEVHLDTANGFLVDVPVDYFFSE